MQDRNLILIVASYEDASLAAEDFESLKAVGDTAVVAAVVLERDAAGDVEVKEHGGGLVGGGTAAGAVAGFVVGLFAPPLLLATVVGAGIGAGAGVIAKHHEEKKIGVAAEDWLPPGSSALVAIVDDLYLDRVDAAITKAAKKIDKAVDKGDAEKVAKAIDEGGARIVEALES